ncbi:MAG: hypothetical protein IJ552_07550 [Prevotella sp.]|nr:hypothetical protein [Prevotella sp.]
MTDSPEKQIIIEDLPQKRIFNTLRKLRREGQSTSKVWCLSYQQGNRIVHSLIMPKSYKKHLFPLMQKIAVDYNGKPIY